jgi:hypothetical protein
VPLVFDMGKPSVAKAAALVDSLEDEELVGR